ncbi:MAG: 4Fe-4S dicluster domain-containing protein, partial [Candidatus Heimdallarchaeota archaeon]
CMQCEEPSCASVCPTKAALIKESKGKAYTTIDITKCFGCKYCNLVCPFNVPQFDPKGKTAIKCTFCDERLDQGLRPACFEACPTGAIKFGVREKIRKLAIERAKEINGYVYGLNEAGGTNILLILPMQPRELGLPEIDKEPYDSISVLKRILVEKTGIPKFILALITFISLIILTLVI